MCPGNPQASSGILDSGLLETRTPETFSEEWEMKGGPCVPAIAPDLVLSHENRLIIEERGCIPVKRSLQGWAPMLADLS